MTTEFPYCGTCGARRQSASDSFCRRCGGSFEGPPTPAAHPFCGACGVERFSGSDRHCRSCGSPFAEFDAGPAPAPSELPSGLPQEWSPSRRPLWLVAGLALATFGLYVIVWLGLTWAEMKRDLRDEGMSPVWHALSVFVPVYGYFRFYAHYRTINTLLQKAGSPDAAQAGLAVVALISANFMATLADIVADRPVLAAMLLLVAAGLVAWVVSHGQAALNRYWTLTSPSVVPYRVAWWQVLILVVGAIFYLLLILGR